MCLESLTTDLYFTSNDYLYHGNCFGKLNFKSPISRQNFLYYFPQIKIVYDEVYFEKETKSILRMFFNEDGFDKHGFNRKGFDRKGYNRKEFAECGYNSNKGLACKEKLKQAITENPNIYQEATLRLKHNVDLAIFFLEQSGSFSLTSKHLRKYKKIVKIAVERYPNSFQYIGRNLKDDDDIFKLAFQQNEGILRYASERLGKITIQS